MSKQIIDHGFGIIETRETFYTEETISKLNQQIAELQKQLKSQPAEIMEKIRKWGQKHYNWVGDGTGYDGQDYNECIGFNKAIDQLNGILDTILKEYQK